MRNRTLEVVGLSSGWKILILAVSWSRIPTLSSSSEDSANDMKVEHKEVTYIGTQQNEYDTHKINRV